MPIGDLVDPNSIIAPTAAVSPLGLGGLWDWVALSGLAVTTSAVLLAFMYLWATLFRNSQLIGYVKSELYELVVSVLLVIFLFSAVGAMTNLKMASFLPDELLPEEVDHDTTIYQATAMYYEELDGDMGGWLQMNYILNVYVDQVASVTPYSRPLGVGLVASPMAGLASPIKQLLYNMTTALSVAFIINYAQLSVYIFSLQAFLKYYLPLGIFLRCFTPTRRIGGTLIGTAVTFLFVFPALTCLTYSMFYARDIGPLVTFNDMFMLYMNDVFGSDTGVFAQFYDQNFASGGQSVIDMLSGAFGAIGTLFSALLGNAFLMLLLLPMSTISLAFAIGFVMPAFNILVFTQSARGLSKSFGEEVDISSLTRMI